ncbi:hypothetical protein BT67DRAFT_59967 [Trichocladium antarcticum]|uniref:Uncharacterized protein n=1 Tax=Trichocladium antarcticum TaxID=1450529 RepID=A0AAN6UHQ7_9PEZI|nr:hypothetical protein BT67DRAFT_59967 [Trichocladium antarcticum]
MLASSAAHHPQPDDPFQSLYHSFTNLTLTNPPPATPPSPIHTIPHPPFPSTTPIPVTISIFPPGDNVIFAHSSFFARRAAAAADLPTPAEVRQHAAAVLHPAEDTTTITHVPFPALGLLVKYGAGVRAAAEGKGMLLLRRYLDADADVDVDVDGSGGAGMGAVVPEVFGWRRDGGEGFVYMALPEGERVRVCEALRAVVGGWRRLRLGGEGFVGEFFLAFFFFWAGLVVCLLGLIFKRGVG